MENEYQLNEEELKELEKSAQKNTVVKKALELIELIQANPAINAYIALSVTHNNICKEVMENDVKLFNTDPEFAKTFDGYLKWKDKLISDVDAMGTLKNKLLPQEEVIASKKIKGGSNQLHIAKPQLNGNRN